VTTSLFITFTFIIVFIFRLSLLEEFYPYGMIFFIRIILHSYLFL